MLRAGLGRIWVDGVERPDVQRVARSLTVERSIGTAAVLRLSLEDHRLNYMDYLFDPERETTVRVEMGYWPKADLHFEGHVGKIEAQFLENGAPRLSVTCYDRSMKLRKAERTRTWEGITDKQLFTEIAAEHGMQVDLDVDPTVFEHVSQSKETDMHFIERRAAQRGYYVFVDGNTLVVRSRERVEPSHVFEYRGALANLRSFRPRWRTLKPKREVLVLSWDATTKSAVIGRSDDRDQTGGREVVVDEQPASHADAVRMAMAQRETAEITALEAEAIPYPVVTKLALGSVVEVRNVGRRFSGGYFVAGDEITWGSGGLAQRVTLQQALELAEREMAAASSGGLTPEEIRAQVQAAQTGSMQAADTGAAEGESA